MTIKRRFRVVNRKPRAGDLVLIGEGKPISGGKGIKGPIRRHHYCRPGVATVLATKGTFPYMCPGGNHYVVEVALPATGATAEAPNGVNPLQTLFVGPDCVLIEA